VTLFSSQPIHRGIPLNLLFTGGQVHCRLSQKFIKNAELTEMLAHLSLEEESKRKVNWDAQITCSQFQLFPASLRIHPEIHYELIINDTKSHYELMNHDTKSQEFQEHFEEISWEELIIS
jgi:hypothetical protein